LVLLFSNIAHGHGDSHGGDEKKAHTATNVSIRSKPSSVRILSNAGISALGNLEKVPEDVAVVRCALDAYPCRGISIELLDAAKTVVAVGHSGTEGVIGFEGLSLEREYFVRIKAQKYSGEAALRAGSAIQLQAEPAKNL